MRTAFSLVRGGRTHPVVEPGPAHGAGMRRLRALALAAQAPARLGPHRTRPRRAPAGARRHGLRQGPARVRRAAPRPARHLDQPGRPASLSQLACGGIRAQHRNLDRRRAGRRPVRRQPGAHVLWRIDVRARHRRLQDRPGAPGGFPAPPPGGLDRLPAADRPPGAPGRASGAARASSNTSPMPSRNPACRGAAAGSTAPACCIRCRRPTAL